MTRFPSSLPCDIVLCIFSYLDQKDSVECMRVCHHWHSVIPVYCRELWEQITISSSSWSKRNDCTIKCLGPQVKYVHIHAQHTCGIVNTLKKLNCAPVKLEIDRHMIATAEHDVCHLPTSSPFLSAINQYRYTLKELSITDHPSDLPISQLLFSLPNLTHLTVLLKENIYHHSFELPVDSRVNSESRASNLIYLKLDRSLHFDRRIIPVLRQCPKLKALSLYSATSNIIRVPDNFAKIFRLCSHISHFAWNIGDTSDMEETFNASIMDGNHGNGGEGIKYFMLQGDINDINRTASTLAASHHTLENLTLINTGANPNQWNALSHTDFPRLTKLSLRYLTLPHVEWGPFFAYRPNLVKFVYFIISLGRLHLDSMFEGIRLLKYLKDLRITRLVNTAESDLWSNAHMLSNNTNLQRLDLTGINLTDDVLLDLCKVGSLTEISISSSPHVNYYITSEGLLRFTEKLRTMDCSIKKLTLGSIGNMNDTVLGRLGHVQNLSMLYIRQCKNISDAGVIAFLRHDNNKSKKIHLLGCPLASRSEFWTCI